MKLQFPQPRHLMVAQLFVILLFVTILFYCCKIEFYNHIRCDSIQVYHLSGSRIEITFKELSGRNDILILRSNMTLEVENEIVTGTIYKHLKRADGLLVMGILTTDSLKKNKYSKGDITIRKTLFEYIVENVSSR